MSVLSNPGIRKYRFDQRKPPSQTAGARIAPLTAGEFWNNVVSFASLATIVGIVAYLVLIR